MASESSTRVLLVTANIGSIFENPSVMLKIWTEEFLNTVTRLDPYFIALHCQEVGGKNYEESMKHVSFFVNLLMTSKELRIFNRAQVFLDEEFTSAENFTVTNQALGNFYFIHQVIKEASLWDFNEQVFLPVTEKTIYSGNIEHISTKEKSKFPQEFFPECKWSRKGFLRTRWKLNGTVFDLVNIHLFHDASNFTAMESHSSVYSVMRQKALQYTLERFRNHNCGLIVPFFLFGDFNFRTDTKAVITKLVEGLDIVKDNVDKDNLVVQYTDSSKEVIFTLKKKEFCHQDHQNTFVSKSGSWLKEYDNELKFFEDQLFEFKINFQPSYPFEENEHEGTKYMKTRCPAWCDRVVLSAGAKHLIHEMALEDEHFSGVEYDLIGKKTCMGDHKPVYLKCDIMNNAGIVDIVDCACKLNRVSPETENPLHAFLGNCVCVDLDDCVAPIVDNILPDYTLLGEVKIPPTQSSSTLNNHDIMLVKRNSPENHNKKYNRFACGFLRKKNPDKNSALKSTFPASSCVCKTYKWKFPTIVQKAWKHNRRVRLKSVPSINKMPLQRHQSHHSSSEEDWFEEIADDDFNDFDEKYRTKCDDENKRCAYNADSCSTYFDAESNRIEMDKFDCCSASLSRKCCDELPSEEKKNDRKDSKNACRIL